MRKIDVDDDVYEHIARNTREIGESASSILRRLLGLEGPPGNDGPRLERPVGQVTRPPTPSTDAPKPPTIPSPLHTLLCSAEFTHLRQAVDRFLALLTWLHRRDPAKFDVVQEVRGKRRVYFAKSQQEILAGGRSTHPRRVPGTPWYVITNNDTPKKQSILAEVMSRLRYDRAEIEEAVSCIEPEAANRRNRSLIDLQSIFADSQRDEDEDPGQI
jgi:negative modulator of initiation of replication